MKTLSAEARANQKDLVVAPLVASYLRLRLEVVFLTQWVHS